MSFRVYIGKTSGVSREELYAICSQFGQMVDFMIKEKYAFAEFATDMDARKAVIGLDGRYINGQRIVAEPAKSKSASDSATVSSPRVYVGRLNANITREVLMSCFARYGEVQDIMRKEDYAFVEFAESSSAIQSVKELNGLFLLGTKLVVEGARPKEESKEVRSTRLYVGKITPVIKKQDLVQAFGCFGDIVDILLKEDYAFVEYTTTAAAAKALVAMNNSRISGQKIVVEEAKHKEIGSLGGNSRRLNNSMGGHQGNHHGGGHHNNNNNNHHNNNNNNNGQGQNSMAVLAAGMSVNAAAAAAAAGQINPLHFLFPTFVPQVVNYQQPMMPYNMMAGQVNGGTQGSNQGSTMSNHTKSPSRRSTTRSRSRSVDKKSKNTSN